MGMNAPQSPQSPAGGLIGMLLQIPQYIQALKVQKQQQQLLQTMLAGRTPFTDFVQKNLVNIEETDPQKRGALATAELGRAPSGDEQKRLEDLPQQLPPAQQEAERKAIDTVVERGLAQAGKTGTAAALTAAVKFNYSRMQKAGYTDDEINALLDPSLDKLSPMELEKIAEGKATAGLKDAQANFLRESASAKIEKFKADAQYDLDRGAALKQNAASTAALVPYKQASLRASVQRAYNSAATAASTNAKNNAEAKWYSERAVDLQTEGDPRQTIAALSSIRAAKASTDSGIRSIESDITRIQSSLNAGVPSLRAKNDQIINGLKAQADELKARSQQYDSALTTLSNRMAPGAGLSTPPTSTGGTTSPVTGASTGPPQGSVRVQNASGQLGWRYPDGTVHPDANP